MKKNKLPETSEEMCGACVGTVQCDEVVSECPHCGSTLIACNACLVPLVDQSKNCTDCGSNSGNLFIPILFDDYDTAKEIIKAAKRLSEINGNHGDISKQDAEEFCEYVMSILGLAMHKQESGAVHISYYVNNGVFKFRCSDGNSGTTLDKSDADFKEYMRKVYDIVGKKVTFEKI